MGKLDENPIRRRDIIVIFDQEIWIKIAVLYFIPAHSSGKLLHDPGVLVAKLLQPLGLCRLRKSIQV